MGREYALAVTGAAAGSIRPIAVPHHINMPIRKRPFVGRGKLDHYHRDAVGL